MAKKVTQKEIKLTGELVNILVERMPDIKEVRHPWKNGAASAIGGEILKDYRWQTEQALMDAIKKLSQGTFYEKVCTDLVKHAEEVFIALDEKEE